MEKKIIEIITQTHLTPKEQANKILDLFSVSQQSELLLQCYKEGFQAAVDSLVAANEAVKNKTLQ